jgi:hypothetical protein
MSCLGRVPAILPGLTLLVLLAAWFWAMGAFDPPAVPVFSGSRREVIGMALMLTLLPPYLVAGAIAVQRYSLRLLDELRPPLVQPQDRDEVRRAIEAGWRHAWPFGVVLGLVMGSLNTSLAEALAATIAPRVHLGLTMGQIVIWLLIGLVLAIRFETARAFRRLGRVVELDLFRLDQLKPLARSGLADMMVVAGALAISPLQSLDAEFRWYNYHFALIVSGMAVGLLLVWPLWPVHRRVRAEKARRIGEIDALIAPESSASDRDAIQRVEVLLAHRDRVAGLRTWILSTDLAWRFFFYLVIPPLAWAGAALVERGVDRLLSP